MIHVQKLRDIDTRLLVKTVNIRATLGTFIVFAERYLGVKKGMLRRPTRGTKGEATSRAIAITVADELVDCRDEVARAFNRENASLIIHCHHKVNEDRYLMTRKKALKAEWEDQKRSATMSEETWKIMEKAATVDTKQGHQPLLDYLAINHALEKETA